MADVLLEKTDGVVLVTLNRPDSLNAMGGTLVGDLADALADCERDHDVRCVALTGAGRGFCAGGDMKGFAQRAGAGAGGDGDGRATEAPREAPSVPAALERSAARLFRDVSRTSLRLHTMP